MATGSAGSVSGLAGVVGCDSRGVVGHRAIKGTDEFRAIIGVDVRAAFAYAGVPHAELAGVLLYL
jgi:hypothetical protein